MAIDEKNLIEDLKNTFSDSVLNQTFGFGKYTLLEAVEEMINRQPQVETDTNVGSKWIPCKVENIIDTIISHNEIVALWYEDCDGDISFHQLVWKGMAWDIPQVYKRCEFEKIFGTVTESIVDADTINISIKLSKEASIKPIPYKKEGAE